MSTQSAAPAREQFSGQYGFLMSAIGSAVGLGNIWRFPGVAYTNGGGAFLIPYLVALLTAGIPILMLDYALGHRYRGSAPAVFRRLGKKFEFVGWLQVAVCVVIMSYYVVVLAWAASYVGFSTTVAWGDDPAGFFTGEYLNVSDPAFTLQLDWAVFWPVVVLWVLVFAVMAGRVSRGLELVNKFAIPALLLMFLTLVVRALFLPGALEGLNAFFTPDWAALANPAVWVAAYTQIFFSLSVAFGIMLTYSSYLKARSNMVPTGLVAAFANSSFELLAGFGVFATLGYMAHTQGVAVADLDSIAGVTLSFITFPQVIGTMPGGPLFGIMFFGSLLLAGFTSLVSILEVIVAAVREKFALSRPAAVGLVIGAGAIGSVVLFSTTNGLNALDIVDAFANNIGILTGAVLECIVVVFLARKLRELQLHLNQVSTLRLGDWWRWAVGILNPIVLLYVLVVTVFRYATVGYDPASYPASFNALFGWGTVVFILAVAAVATAMTWRTPVDRFTPVPLDDPARPVGRGVSA
ncbi:sodium-dependent transporter [Propioniciclava soli]|uniref:Sodium-dependent transporter n=1 Tax=Propioniciclava soli TaxID=2775081 RepID=A0ABZ3C8L7_9ACTN|nr:sodium-dependent transporter [Propioniciclava soli]